MSEQLKTNGTIISARNNVEVTFISKNGLILMVGDTEYYLPYGKFPWFKTASVSDVFDVQMKGKNRIRWEASPTADDEVKVGVCIFPLMTMDCLRTSLVT